MDETRSFSSPQDAKIGVSPEIGGSSTANVLHDAIGLVLNLEENAQGTALIDWLAHHPDRAGELADFLATQRGLRKAMIDGSPFDPVRSELQSGTLLGRFELKEEIGRGGMGVVYKAYDPKLKRIVALKLVLAGAYTTAEELARFKFEAEAVAGLDHPGVVPIHEFDQVVGMPYLVMPYQEGGSLAQRLKTLGANQPISPRVAAALVRDVALGVNHAHQRGFLHRDLKPANILLDREGQPRVADFGLAITLQSTRSLSRSGAIVGTAAYMAPEQAVGQKGLTTAVDVHALGAVLYELLTRTPPFGRGDWLTTISRVQNEQPPSPRRLRPDVPADLETICLTCLQKQPNDRYYSALSLAEDLTRFLEGEPVRAQKRAGISSIVRAINRRAETLSMTSWPAFFIGAASRLAVDVSIQALIFSGKPSVWPFFILMTHQVIWLMLIWYFLFHKASRLSKVERLSSAIQIGMWVATTALWPPHMAFHGWDVLPIYPSMEILFGLGIFAHGVTHWGRFFVVGLIWMISAGLFPLVPSHYWPALSAVIYVPTFLWMGLNAHRFDRESHNTIFGRMTENDPAS